MKVIYQAESQGNVLRLYHHGYLTVHPRDPHYGFQLTDEIRRELVTAYETTKES